VWTKDGGRDLGPAYKEVVLTDHRTGREWKLDPVPWSVYSDGVRFSPDGTRLVVQGHLDRDWKRDSVSVWDAGTGRRLVSVSRPAGRVAAAALSPDGRSLLVGDPDGKLAVVEVATGQERAAFQHAGEVLSAAFSPDGTKAVASSPDAPVYVWDLLGTTARWEPAQADVVWTDLASPDAKVGYAAVRKLRANPAEAVALLKDRVKLPSVPAEDVLAGWLKGLDAPAFADREKAQRDLAAVADLVRPKLEAARKGASAEAAGGSTRCSSRPTGSRPTSYGRCGRARCWRGSGRQTPCGC
jgi:dipeptidyl aminopeptidase/acylaminoacyl peptidase